MTAEAGKWDVASILESFSYAFPEAEAQVCDDRSFTWSEFAQRAGAVATTMSASGLLRQDKVAQYLYNGPEYLESVFASFRAGLVPVNTNYRYTEEELWYLWDNADVAAVVFHDEFAGRCERLRQRLPGIRLWLHVGDPDRCPPWALPYETAATSPPAPATTGVRRSGDDLILLYTGGTTGSPKGVMWRQHDLLAMLQATRGSELPARNEDPGFLVRNARLGIRSLPVAPLMHGTGLWFAISTLMQAGTVVTMSDRRFSADRVLDTIVSRRVGGIVIAGDAFATPIVQALDNEPGRWALSGLKVLVSSGVLLSDENKRGLLRHAPHLRITDTLGSSESGSFARSAGEASPADGSPRFVVSDGVRVIGDDGIDVVAGSTQIGRLAVSGHIPVGYYKDPEKTAATFLTLDGTRYVVAGDFAEVGADSTIRFLGRGSACINTGGEKVHPEEVEAALKRQEAIFDAAVVGLPDHRFGEVVVALVEPRTGAHIDLAGLDAVLRTTLAGYKVPRRVLVVETIGRQANGKLDYRALRRRATELLGPSKA